MRALFFLAVVLSAQDANWPQFRGPNASGIAPSDAAPPVDFSNRQLWKTALPAGHSSPAVWGDRIFLNSFDPESKKLELLCLSSKTGKILWRRTAAAAQLEVTHEVSNPATATPALDADRVYSYFSSYGIMAFTHSGDPAWTLPLPMPKTHHGSGASPILAGDLLILNHDAMQGGYLLAIDRATGKQVWKHEYPHIQGRVESYSTPIVFHDQLVLHRAGVVESYQTSTGELTWSLPETTSGTSSPVASEGIVFVNTWNILGEDDQRPVLPDFASLVKENDKNGDGILSESEFPTNLKYTSRPGLDEVPSSQNFAAFKSIDKNKDGIVQESEWEAFRTRVTGMTQDHGLLAIRPNGSTPTVLWRDNTSIPEVPSPLLYKDRLYLVRNGGIVTCLNAADGTLVYRSRSGSPGPYFASPVAAAGRVYLASQDGTVTVLAAGKDQIDVLARNKLDEDIIATPAIAGNVIYVRTLGSLYAFSGASK